MKRFALLAAAAALFATPAIAGDIGGGVAVGNMGSFAAGGTGVGNLNLSGVAGTGVISSSVTASAHNDQLAGTVSKLEKLPNGFTASIVSEVQGNSWTNVTQNTLVANGLQIQLSGAGAGGFGLSSGNQFFVTGYLNW